MTDEMVRAACRVLPDVWNHKRLADAIQAALDVAPRTEQVIDVPVTAVVHLEVDHDQMEAAVLAATERLREQIGTDPTGRLRLATLDEPVIFDSGLEGPGVRDASGSLTTIPVHEPHVDPALGRPLALGGVAEVGAHFGVARSTVNGWVKNAPSNGMPAPIQQLAAGPVWDLNDLDAWYRAWKGGD